MQEQKNKYTSPANEFILHTVEAIEKKIIILKKYTSPANEFLSHRCKNNRKMIKSEKIYKSS